jgi:hypothetical protein
VVYVKCPWVVGDRCNLDERLWTLRLKTRVRRSENLKCRDECHRRQSAGVVGGAANRCPRVSYRSFSVWLGQPGWPGIRLAVCRQAFTRPLAYCFCDASGGRGRCVGHRSRELPVWSISAQPWRSNAHVRARSTAVGRESSSPRPDGRDARRICRTPAAPTQDLGGRFEPSMVHDRFRCSIPAGDRRGCAASGRPSRLGRSIRTQLQDRLRKGDGHDRDYESRDEPDDDVCQADRRAIRQPDKETRRPDGKRPDKESQQPGQEEDRGEI